MKNVLITSFGSNTSIGVAKSLKKHFNIIGADTNDPSLCNGYIFANVLEKLPKYTEEIQYESVLNSFIDKHNIDLIIPVHDKEIELLAKLYEQGKIYAKVAVNTPDIVNLCNSKSKINYFLSDLVNVPFQYFSEDEIKFPVIVKDEDGVSSRGISIAYKKENLTNINFEGKLVQEFISDGIEYTVDCYTSYISEEFYYSVRKRTETKAGMSVKSEIIKHEILGELCREIHSKLNYKGVSNIQFIIKNEEIYFIEINPRFAGGGILTYMSGYNFPFMTVMELCYDEVCKPENLAIGNKMVRYYEETFFDSSDNCIRLG